MKEALGCLRQSGNNYQPLPKRQNMARHEFKLAELNELYFILKTSLDGWQQEGKKEDSVPHSGNIWEDRWNKLYTGGV